jgi:hypothetical protein
LLGHKLFLPLRLWFCGRNGLWFVRAPGQYRFDPRYVATEQTQPARLLELSALLLQAQVQTFLAKIAPFRQQLVRAHLDYFFNFHLR